MEETALFNASRKSKKKNLKSHDDDDNNNNNSWIYMEIAMGARWIKLRKYA